VFVYRNRHDAQPGLARHVVQAGPTGVLDGHAGDPLRSQGAEQTGGAVRDTCGDHDIVGVRHDAPAAVQVVCQGPAKLQVSARHGKTQIRERHTARLVAERLTPPGPRKGA
jgi:hypothetical protein